MDALTDQAVSEENMFEYYNDIHVFSPGAGANNSWGPMFFININIIPICSFKVNFLQDDIFSFFSIQMHWRPTLTLP